jgi:alpha-mannosidase
MAFEQEFRLVSTDVHSGSLPYASEPIELADEGIILSAVKKSEDEDALLLRFFDPTGQAARVKATLDAGFFGEVVGVEEVDLMERPVAETTAGMDGNTVSVALPARGIASVKIRLNRRSRGCEERKANRCVA